MRRGVCTIRGSSVHGIITFEQSAPGRPVYLDIHLAGFPRRKRAQPYAIHIHAFGDLREGCASLGPHWNPERAAHGAAGKTPSCHAGDLMNNVFPAPDGTVTIERFSTPRLSLFGDESIFGRSVVIHASSDDLGMLGLPIFDVSRDPPPVDRVIKYQDMETTDLRQIIVSRGLSTDPRLLNGHRRTLLDFLEEGSRTTGNAGRRMACGIIGRAGD